MLTLEVFGGYGEVLLGCCLMELWTERMYYVRILFKAVVKKISGSDI